MVPPQKIGLHGAGPHFVQLQAEERTAEHDGGQDARPLPQRGKFHVDGRDLAKDLGAAQDRKDARQQGGGNIKALQSINFSSQPGSNDHEYAELCEVNQYVC